MDTTIDAVVPKPAVGDVSRSAHEDSLALRFSTNWAVAAMAMVIPLGGRRVVRDDFAAADRGRPAAYNNAATLLRPLTPAATPRVMGALDAFFGFAEGGRTGEVYLFSAWPPPDLAPFGWEQAGTPPLLRLPPGVALPPAPPELRVERVRDAAGARAWEAVAVRGYPFAECEPVAPGALVDERVLRDPRLRLWVGWVGDLPVCASAAFVAAGLSAVTMVVTVPAMRGRGYGAAISATAAESEPGLPALLTASDLGAPGYERLGFRRVGRFSVWSRFRP